MAMVVMFSWCDNKSRKGGNTASRASELCAILVLSRRARDLARRTLVTSVRRRTKRRRRGCDALALRLAYLQEARGLWRTKRVRRT